MPSNRSTNNNTHLTLSRGRPSSSSRMLSTNKNNSIQLYNNLTTNNTNHTITITNLIISQRIIIFKVVIKKIQKLLISFLLISLKSINRKIKIMKNKVKMSKVIFESFNKRIRIVIRVYFSLEKQKTNKIKNENINNIYVDE